MKKLKDIVENITKVSPGAWVRLILLVLALVNTFLRMAGVDTIPFVETEIADAVSLVFTICITLNAYWKNNSFTAAAQAADGYLAELRRREDEQNV